MIDCCTLDQKDIFKSISLRDCKRRNTDTPDVLFEGQLFDTLFTMARQKLLSNIQLEGSVSQSLLLDSTNITFHSRLERNIMPLQSPNVGSHHQRRRRVRNTSTCGEAVTSNLHAVFVLLLTMTLTVVPSYTVNAFQNPTTTSTISRLGGLSIQSNKSRNRLSSRTGTSVCNHNNDVDEHCDDDDRDDFFKVATVTATKSRMSSGGLSNCGGMSIGSRSSSLYYKGSVVRGSDGGRPQVSALDMVVCNDSGDIQQLDKNEYQLHVGRALDTLRSDYPKILTCDPDYSIYDTHIDIIDPSGVKVRGLQSYKRTFRLLHAVVKILACPSKSGIEMRMCYDQARQNIRIHWNAYIVPRDIFGGPLKTNYVDGISVYTLDKYSGNITEHRIERLLLNDIPLSYERGMIAALQEKHAVVLPNFIEQLQPSKDCYQYRDELILATVPGGGTSGNIIVPFQEINPANLFQFRQMADPAPSSLFALEATNGGDGSAAIGGATASNGKSNNKNHKNTDDVVAAASLQQQSLFPTMDWTAFENKNKSRQKFGLKPLSPEEYMAVEMKVHQLTKVQEEKEEIQRQQVAAAAAAADESNNKKNNKVGNIFGKMFANVLPDSCESNYDCERPEICCDFGFQKRCCFSGSPVGKAEWSQMRPIRVAADMNNYPPNSLPPSNNNRY